MGYFAEFDHLMPGHNQPWLDKGLLPETVAGAEKVISGQAGHRTCASLTLMHFNPLRFNPLSSPLLAFLRLL